jgi:hypothetical protein
MRTRIRGLLAAAILTGGARRLLTPGVTTGDTGRIGRQTVKLIFGILGRGSMLSA